VDLGIFLNWGFQKLYPPSKIAFRDFRGIEFWGFLWKFVYEGSSCCCWSRR